MAESVLVNGVSLDTYAYMLSDSSGLMTTPPTRPTGQRIPGRHGELRLPGRRFDPGQVVLRLVVNGALADGTVPGGSNERREFFLRRDELVRLLRADPVNVDFTPEVGVVPYRRAVCQLDEQMSFIRVADRPDAEVDVVLSVPDAFWAELATVTATATVTTGGTLSLATFAPANAPIADGMVTFGAGANPTLVYGAGFLAYDGVIAAGRQLTVDCSDWSLGFGAGTPWAPSLSNVRYAPGPSLFELEPAVSLTAVLNHTGGSTQTVSFTGRRKFLVA